jgi:hypothetical protein
LLILEGDAFLLEFQSGFLSTVCVVVVAVAAALAEAGMKKGTGWNFSILVASLTGDTAAGGGVDDVDDTLSWL